MFVKLKLQTSKVFSFAWLSMVQPVFVDLIVNLDADRSKSHSPFCYLTLFSFFSLFWMPHCQSARAHNSLQASPINRPSCGHTCFPSAISCLLHLLLLPLLHSSFASFSPPNQDHHMFQVYAGMDWTGTSLAVDLHRSNAWNWKPCKQVWNFWGYLFGFFS